MANLEPTETGRFSLTGRRALGAGWILCASIACACGGQVESRSSDGGATGANNTWDPCSTSAPGPHNERDSGSPAPRGDAGTIPPGTTPPGTTPPGTIPPGATFAGASTFVALFPVADGALVVASDGVRHIGRDGTTVTMWTSPREITSAAYDGTLLGVADKGVLTTLNRTFATVSTVQLTESCVASIILSGQRFVCSPGTDWGHVSYVFDLKSGSLLNTSVPTTYQGIQMQRIPGTDDFVTVTYGSPAHFDLHRLTSTGSIDFLGESPDHGVFPVSEVYTVVGTPGTHVLTETGLLLKIYHDDATVDAGPYQAPFFKDGALGTLGDSQSFVALDKDGDQIFGVVAARTSSNPLCGSGCWLQHVDAQKRLIVSTSVHRLNGDKVLGFRHDTVPSHAWLVMSPPGVDSWQSPAGFVVYLLDY